MTAVQAVGMWSKARAVVHDQQRRDRAWLFQMHCLDLFSRPDESDDPMRLRFGGKADRFATQARLALAWSANQQGQNNRFVGALI